MVPPYNTPLPIFILKQSVNRGITVARVCPTKPAIYMIMSWGEKLRVEYSLPSGKISMASNLDRVAKRLPGYLQPT